MTCALYLLIIAVPNTRTGLYIEHMSIEDGFASLLSLKNDVFVHSECDQMTHEAEFLPPGILGQEIRCVLVEPLEATDDVMVFNH